MNTGQRMIPDSQITHHYRPMLQGAKNATRHRYVDGKLVPMEKPRPVFDPTEAKKIKQAQAEAAGLSAPVESKHFNLAAFRPLSGYVLLDNGRVVEEQDGIVIPQSHRQTNGQHRVLSVGGGDHGLNVGDLVGLSINAHARRFKIDNVQLMLVRAVDVAAIIET